MAATISSEEKQAAEVVDVLRASFKAKKTLPEAWRRQQLLQLQKMMVENRAQFVQALHEDLHKNEVEGYYTEVNLLEQEIQHMLDELHELMQPEVVKTNLLNIPGWSRIYKDSLGVVMVMGTWNYPIQLTLLPVVGAIAAGNCVVITVPNVEYATASARTVATLCAQYLDQSCIRVLGGEFAQIKAVLEHRFDKIFFTGGSSMGTRVYEAAAKHLTPVCLELGGKSPAVVCASADVTIAAKRITWASFMNSGQTCVRPDYVLVHDSVADRFLEEVKKASLTMYGEDAQKSDCYGRVVNAGAQSRLEQIVQEAKATNKANIVIGGSCDTGNRYIAPTVLDYAEDEAAFRASAAMRGEIFGPILPVMRFKDLQWAVDFVREGDKPLSVYPFSSSSQDHELILRETSSGGVDVNDCMMRLSNADLPFGGVGGSGIGDYHGVSSFMCFSHRKSVNFKPSNFDLPVRYPPYVPWKRYTLAVVQGVYPARFVRLLKVLFAMFGLRVVRRLRWPSHLLVAVIRLLLGGAD